MKQIIDLLPVIAFVAAYFTTKDMIYSTYVLVGASAIKIAVVFAVWRTVEKMHIATFFILLVMGGLTISLEDPRFMKWKPTVVNWVIATVLLGSQFIGERNLVQRAIEAMTDKMPDVSFNVPAAGWRTLNLYAVLFFIVAGSANIYVAYNFEESVWVTFKLVGLTLLNFVGIILLFIYLSRYMQQDKKSDS